MAISIKNWFINNEIFQKLEAYNYYVVNIGSILLISVVVPEGSPVDPCNCILLINRKTSDVVGFEARYDDKWNKGLLEK